MLCSLQPAQVSVVLEPAACHASRCRSRSPWLCCPASPTAMEVQHGGWARSPFDESPLQGQAVAAEEARGSAPAQGEVAQSDAGCMLSAVQHDGNKCAASLAWLAADEPSCTAAGSRSRRPCMSAYCACIARPAGDACVHCTGWPATSSLGDRQHQAQLLNACMRRWVSSQVQDGGAEPPPQPDLPLGGFPQLQRWRQPRLHRCAADLVDAGVQSTRHLEPAWLAG